MTSTIEYTNKKIEYHLSRLSCHIKKIGIENVNPSTRLEAGNFLASLMNVDLDYHYYGPDTDGMTATIEYSNKKIEYHLSRLSYHIKKIGIENVSKYTILNYAGHLFAVEFLNIDLTDFGDDTDELEVA